MTATVTPSPDNPGALNWALVSGLGVIWGAAFMGQALALEGFGPLTVAALRILFGAIALVLVASAMGQGLGTTLRAGGRRAPLVIAALGVTSAAAPFALLSYGLQVVPSAFAGVAMGAVPLLVLPLVAIFSPEEGIGPRRIVGTLLGFVGLAVLIGPGALGGSSDAVLIGRLACLGAGLCYAISSVITRQAPAMPPVGFAAWALLAGAVPLVPAMIVVEGWPSAWPMTPTLALILTALLPTALAAAIRVRVITTAGSLFMSLVSYMVPVWSVIFGVALLGEVLEPTLFAGLALILAGIGIAQSRALGARFAKRR